MTTLRLTKNSWANLSQAILSLRLDPAHEIAADVRDDLTLLGIIRGNVLTDTGNQIAELCYIKMDDNAVMKLMQMMILTLPATQALLQGLYGLANVTVQQAKLVLLFANAEPNEVDSRLTAYLTFLNRFGVLVYSKKMGTIKLLISPFEAEPIPSHVFVDPKRPFANNYWIRQIIAECRGRVLWIDKYFNRDAFNWLWREASAENITAIHIVSVVPDAGIDDVTRQDYTNLKKELAARGIIVEWKLMPKSESHRIHDRWVLDDAGLCYNIPSTGTISSGQTSELLRSTNFEEVSEMFKHYFEDVAKPIK